MFDYIYECANKSGNLKRFTLIKLFNEIYGDKMNISINDPYALAPFENINEIKLSNEEIKNKFNTINALDNVILSIDEIKRFCLLYFHFELYIYDNYDKLNIFKLYPDELFKSLVQGHYIFRLMDPPYNKNIETENKREMHTLLYHDRRNERFIRVLFTELADFIRSNTPFKELCEIEEKRYCSKECFKYILRRAINTVFSSGDMNLDQNYRVENYPMWAHLLYPLLISLDYHYKLGFTNSFNEASYSVYYSYDIIKLVYYKTDYPFIEYVKGLGENIYEQEQTTEIIEDIKALEEWLNMFYYQFLNNTRNIGCLLHYRAVKTSEGFINSETRIIENEQNEEENENEQNEEEDNRTTRRDGEEPDGADSRTDGAEEDDDDYENSDYIEDILYGKIDDSDDEDYAPRPSPKLSQRPQTTLNFKNDLTLNDAIYEIEKWLMKDIYDIADIIETCGSIIKNKDIKEANKEIYRFIKVYRTCYLRLMAYPLEDIYNDRGESMNEIQEILTKLKNSNLVIKSYNKDRIGTILFDDVNLICDSSFQPSDIYDRFGDFGYLRRLYFDNTMDLTFFTYLLSLFSLTNKKDCIEELVLTLHTKLIKENSDDDNPNDWGDDYDYFITDKTRANLITFDEYKILVKNNSDGYYYGSGSTDLKILHDVYNHATKFRVDLRDDINNNIQYKLPLTSRREESNNFLNVDYLNYA